MPLNGITAIIYLNYLKALVYQPARFIGQLLECSVTSVISSSLIASGTVLGGKIRQVTIA